MIHLNHKFKKHIVKNKYQISLLILLNTYYWVTASILSLLFFTSNAYATTNKVAIGTTHSLAVTTIGTVYCSGTNDFGECNVNAWTDITQVAAGEFFSIGLDTNGNVFCTGWINYELCDVSAFNGSQIVYIAAGATHVVGIDDAGNVIGVGSTNYDKLNVGSWTNIVQVACGENHTVGLKSDNTVVCTGNNYRGQCNVSSWTNISQISAGLQFTIGLQLNNILFTGWNNYSQDNFSGWPQGSISYISAGHEHTVAIDSSFHTWATGQNQDSQCEVDSLPNIVKVVGGPKNTIGIQENGEMFVVGSQNYGTNNLEGFQLINNYPEAVPGSISMYEDYSATTIDLLSLATDYESQPLTIISTNPNALNGTVINHLNGTYTYYPDLHHNGSDCFTYTVTDNQVYNYTGTAIVSISITPVNDPPDYACAHSITLLEDHGLYTENSWACDITTGAYNESDQSLSITWTCSDESMFLSIPTLTPSIAGASGLTLSYAFGADENGTITLTVILSDDGGLDFLEYGAADTITRSYLLTTLAVNDIPTLTATNITILEDAVSEFYTTWANNFGPGAYNEYSQTVSYTLTNDNTFLFSSQPFLDISGTTGSLAYTLSTDMFGESSLTVVVCDDGGTDYSGVDCLTQVFTLTILPVNDIPGFVIGPDRFALEDTSETYTSWATSITPGTFNEIDQQLSFSVNTTCPACFNEEPIIDPATGDMSYTLSADGSGTITIWVCLMDDGATVNGGFDSVTHSFLITVTDINDPPGLTLGTDPVIIEDSISNTISGWATDFTPGSAFETEQALFVSLTNTNPTLFILQPSLDIVTGDLSYSLAANEFGSTTVTVVLSDDGGTALGGIDTITETFTMTILPANDMPDFVIGPDRAILESQNETYTSWATALTCGAFNETEQTFYFSVITSCPDCFASGPFVDAATGDLSYTLSADGSGPVTVWVSLTDSGGTANGGVDTVTYPFSISITDINDPPGCTLGTDPIVLEDSANSIIGWATDITPANKFEIGQSVSFNLTNTNPDLFSNQPAINSANGNLTYTLAANEYGSATITFVLSDDGGTAHGGVDRITGTFLFTVLPVNDPPNFNVGPDRILLEGHGETYTAWASALTSGAFNETEQSFSFSVTTSCNECFAVEPIIYTATGDLSYTLSADANGAITIWVSLIDNGGTSNGGINTTTHPFHITITNINDPPGCIFGGDPTVLEDSTNQIIAGWAKDITPGNIYELEQSVSFSITNNYPALFTHQPYIDSATGDLSYTLAANKFGGVTVTVVIFDDGGTAYGGIDRITKTFAINVLPVNDAPDFLVGPDRTILEGQGETYTAWAKSLTQGDLNETNQSLSFSITTSCLECFISQPIIYTATGDLCYTLSADHNENITVWVTLIDDGGTMNGGVDSVTKVFLINVLPVNDPPDFSIGPDREVLEGSSETYTSWASALTPGAFNEIDQHLSFVVTTSCSECFVSEPIVYTANGNLSYTLSADAFGAITVWVALMDDGGTANSGYDTVTHSFSITVVNINDPPGFTKGISPIVLEDSLNNTIPGWASLITPGNSYETGQALYFSLTNTTPSLFSSQPSIDSSSGDLSYTLAANEYGSATITIVLSDDGGTAFGGVDRITETFLITVLPVNDMPTFSVGPDRTILEAQSDVYTSWATNISTGSQNEADQTLIFDVSTSCNECFSVQPTLSPSSGNLCYTLTADASGIVTVWVILIDSGGTINGGVDAITHSFSITITNVNDPPNFSLGVNPIVLEDSTGNTISGWATHITCGNMYEIGQMVSFSLSNTNPGLFTTQPHIDPLSGDLSYTLTTNEFGSATITAILSDNGGTANGGIDQLTKTFVINVIPVNDPPGFTIGPDRFILEGDAEIYTQWATNMTSGPLNETEQSLSFSVTTSCDECFDSLPVVYTATGNLSYSLAADSGGIVTVWVSLTDDAGTLNGGIDTIAQTFVISITDVNDPPGFTKGSDPSVFEDTTGHTISGWATDITPANKFETVQALEFQLTCTNTTLFVTPPSIDPVSGDLSYTLVANEFGSSTITVVLIDTGGTANSGIDRITETFIFNVLPVNDAPDFTIGPDRTTLEAHGETYTSWATSLTQGAYNEADQEFTFSVTTSCPDCFLSQPVVYTATGDLCYTLSEDHNGNITVWVALTDDGGTANGGVDTITHSFAITIIPVNDPPGFTPGTNPIVDEDSMDNMTSGWAISITPGNIFETDQAVFFSLTNTHSQLFSVQPAIDSETGTLSYTLAANEFGSTTVTVVLSDDGGTANGGIDRITETFFITVLPVNDSPTITTLSNLTIDENSIAGPMAFTIGDIDADALTVTVSSSYTPLIPNNYIVFGETNNNSYINTTRTAFESIPLSITITPLPGQTGTTTISINVTDGIDSDSTIFDITVNSIYHDGPGGVGNTLGGSSLQLWLSADDFTEHSDGDVITSWMDLSGFDNTLTQSFNCPTYTSTFSNNKPAILFNGTNNFFENASALDLIDNSGLTVFAVINAHNYSANQSIIAKDSNNNQGWGCRINSTNQLFFSISQSASESVTTTGANSVTGKNTIVSYVYDGLLGKYISVYEGNTEDSEASDYTPPAKIKNSGDSLRIGNDGENHFFKGRIAELIVYKRFLSTTEHVLVNNYLSSKYNIPLNEKDKYAGDTLVSGDYDWNVIGIGEEADGFNSIAVSSGLVITNTSFLQDNGDYLLFGHNSESNNITCNNIPPSVNTSWKRVWMIHKTDINSNGGEIQIAFDLEMADMNDITPSTDFVLLKRSGPTGSFIIFDEDVSFIGKQLVFTVDTALLNTGDCLTLGSTINYALQFNGLNQSAISESMINLTQTSFTIEYWARRNSIGEMYIIGQGPDVWETNKNLNIGFSATNTIVFGFDDTNTVETTSVYTDTKWHHYAFAYNQGTRVIDIYVDGELSDTSVMPNDYSGSGQLYIGEAPGDSHRFNGELDEIRIWNTVKSASAIFSDRNKNLKGNESNLIYYWQFNQGIGDIAFEKTAILNNLELSLITDAPEWVISSLPMGYSATGHIETMGVNQFTGTGVTMDYNYHNSAQVYVTKVSTEVNILPDADTVFSSQYWVISRSENTSFDANISFMCDDDISGTNAKLAKLFWRENGNPGSWVAIAYGSSIDAGSETIIFNGIKRTGQFMIAYDDYSPMPASGKTLRFDGIDDWAVDETRRIAIDNHSFTIEFWAKRASIGSSHMAIGHSNNAQGLNIGFNADNTFQFSFDTNQSVTHPYTDLHWHHWALTFDSTSLTQTVYCDGVLITNNLAIAPYELTGYFYIGCGSDNNHLFNGLLDDIRIWESVRTQTQIQNNMYVPLNGNETDLMAYYRMDEPWSYTYITDATANSINCEIKGAMKQSDWLNSHAWSNRSTDEDINFTMSAGYDLEGGSLVISANTAPLSGNFSRNNTAKTVTYSPYHNMNGEDNFSFTVATSTPIYPITITIVPINDPPEIDMIDTQEVAANSVADGISFTISDPETAADLLAITPVSSDISIVSNNNILVNCVSGDCIASITPNTNMTGSLSITITVSDPEGLTANSAFELTVNALPEISMISDITNTMNTSFSIAFNVTDTETSNGDLSLTITTSDSNILPLTQTKLMNSNGNCTLALTPTLFSQGTVYIDIIIMDADGYSISTGFNMTIVPMPGSGYMMDFDASYSATTKQNLSFSDHTIESWIKTNTSNWGGIVSTDNHTGKWSQILIAPSGILRVQVFNAGGQEKAYSGSTVVNDLKWHHVAYTYDGSLDTLNLYVDGVKEITSVAVDQALTSFTLNEKVNIGVDSVGSHYFSGTIDDVRIWNTKRSIENIQNNMCQKIDPESPHLIACYRFDQSYGNTLYDLTSNNNHCQLNGGGNWTLSSAPIGDESVKNYNSEDPFSISLAHSDGDLMTLTVTSGSPDGIHLYLVNQSPNTDSVDMGTVKTNRYWGAFIVGSFDFFDYHYAYQQNPHASPIPSKNSIAYRSNNSENWIKKAGSEDSGTGVLNASGFSTRNEVILREVE